MKGIVKTCRKCKKVVNIKFFYPDRLGKYGVASTCKVCVEDKKLEKIKNTPKKIYKAPKRISKKRQIMTKQHLEANIFKHIAEHRPPICQNCNNPILPVDYETPNNYAAFCFAHICPKGTYPELRLMKNNIAFVCSIKCHEWEQF